MGRVPLAPKPQTENCGAYKDKDEMFDLSPGWMITAPVLKIKAIVK